MPTSENPLTPMNARLNVKRCRFSSASAPTTAPSTRLSWPPSSTQSMPGTSASVSATPRLVVNVESRRPLPCAASGAGDGARPWSRCRGRPSRRPAAARRRPRAIASLLAWFDAWRPASSRSTFGCRASAPPWVRFRSPRDWSDLRSLRIVGSVTPNSLASSPIRARPRTDTSSAIRACRSSANTGPRRSKASDMRRSVHARIGHGWFRSSGSDRAHFAFRSPGVLTYRVVCDLLDGSSIACRTIGIETAAETRHRHSGLGILTSGGDAPGMNAVVAGACEDVERLGGRASGIRGGFAGLARARAEPIALRTRDHAWTSRAPGWGRAAGRLSGAGGSRRLPPRARGARPRRAAGRRRRRLRPGCPGAWRTASRSRSSRRRSTATSTGRSPRSGWTRRSPTPWRPSTACESPRARCPAAPSSCRPSARPTAFSPTRWPPPPASTRCWSRSATFDLDALRPAP